MTEIVIVLSFGKEKSMGLFSIRTLAACQRACTQGASDAWSPHMPPER